MVVVKKGTEVSKVAERAGHYLVVAEDPKDPTRKVMGWSSDVAFGGAGGGFHGGPAMHPGDGGARRRRQDGFGGRRGAAAGGGFSCMKQQGGKCAAPYVVSQAVCRLACKTAAECKGPDPKCNGGLCYASNGCQ